MRLLTSSEMRELDRRAIETLGMPGFALMEHAARHVASAVRRHSGPLEGRKVLCVCGRGNNGGDGLAVARMLRESGADARVALLASGGALKGDAALNHALCKRTGVPIKEFKSEQSLAGLAALAADAGVVVDAILGTGAKGQLSPFFEKAIRFLNSAGAEVYAVDAPSGINADDGTLLGAEAVRCRHTVTFGALKAGLFVHPGAGYAGRVHLADIGIPSAAAKGLKRGAGSGESIGPEDVAPLLGPRWADSHKGSFGRLAIVGGSRDMPGAPALAAASALRMGAGLVFVAAPEGIRSLVHQRDAEIMSRGYPETADGEFSLAAFPALLEFCERADAVALGPGLGRSAEASEVARRLALRVTKPMAIDADGLNALAEGKPGLLKKAAGPRVLTPHMGEMARLLNVASRDVLARRLDAAARLAKRENAVTVMKGPGSIVAAPDGGFKVNVTGNPGMAAAGAGDVLTGAVAALLAQGVSPVEAAAAGVYLHGLAGDLAASVLGERSLVATDIVAAIPEALHACSKPGAPRGFEFQAFLTP